MIVRFILLLTFSIILLRSNAELRAQQAMIRSYTISDGLVMNRVRGFHQDAEGFIWIYTWDGLSRYEGYRFRNYIPGKDLAHGLINDIVEYPDGAKYVALNDGTVEVIRDLEVQPGERTKGDIINSFLTDEHGKIYATTDHVGICLFEKGKLHPFNPPSPETSLTTALYSGKEIYFVLSDSPIAGVLTADGKTQKIWKRESTIFNCVLKDHQNRILYGTDNGLIEVLNDKTNKNEFDWVEAGFIPENAIWKNWPVYSILQSKNGTYWFGTNNGLVRLAPDGHWTVLTTKDGLPSNSITSLFMDRTQILWIGTDIGAASLNERNSITSYRMEDGLTIDFLLPLKDGFIYGIGNAKKLILLDSLGNVINETIKGTPQNPLLGLMSSGDELGVIHSSGISHLSPHEGSAMSPSASPVSTRYFTKTKNGDIYFISESGLGFCPTDDTCYITSGINKRIETLAAYSGDTLIIGTWGEGLFLVSPFNPLDKRQLSILRDLSSWLPSNEIRSLMISENQDIWIGTRYHGLIRLQCKDDFSSCKTREYKITDGLTSNWITSLAEDRFGNIWVGSISGIDKLILEKDDYRVFSYSRVFDFYKGIHHIGIGDDDVIWCGTSEGYSRIIDGMTDTIGPPKVYLTEAVLGGINHISEISGQVVLPYNKNSANFAFAAPDYTSRSQLSFTYRLKGSQDTMWTTPGNQHQIFYGNLLPGHYQFEVAAFGWNGERGRSLLYSFVIQPPFWRQYWFVCLMVIVTATFLYWIYRMRISQIRRIQQVRDRIATDLHDEIGSSLTQVNILSEIGKQSVLENGKPIEIFERIGSEVQSSSEALDDIIWSVKTRWNDIGDITARMRQYATELLDSSGISFQITEEIDNESPLDMEFRRDLYLAYKELIRNIFKHADATQVDIYVKINGKSVGLLVKDNGKGFNALKSTDRNGMNNIQIRVKRWNGTAKWNSVPGEGTTAQIEMRSQ